MKIVILEREEGFGIGGIGVYNQRLRDFLALQNHQVYTISFSNSKKRDKNTACIPYYWSEKRGYIFVPSEKTIDLIRKNLKKIKPDIVHFNLGISPVDLVIPSLCHEQKIPVLGMWHGDFNSSSTAFSLLSKSIYLTYLPAVKQLDRLIVFSSKMKEFYKGHKIAGRLIEIIPNGVDTNFYAPGFSRFGKHWKIKTGVLFLGRLTLQKNPEVLLSSFLSLNTVPEVKLVVAGDGDLKNDLAEKYQDPRIIFTGMVSNEKKKLDILRSCQIFVLPSLFEGMSLALLEAMSTGLACISSDAGVHSELLKDCGLVIPVSRLKQELPLALRLLLEHRDITKLLAKKGRKKVLASYSQNLTFSQIVKTYQETISDYQKRGYPQTKSLEITLPVRKKLGEIWQKAKELGASYLWGEE